MMTKIKLLMLIIFYLIISASAHAAGGIALGATRIIYPADAKQTAVWIRNSHTNERFLVNSWIENSSGVKEKSFIITPPLFVSEPKSENTLRIIYPADAKQTAVWIRNSHTNERFLVNSWIENSSGVKEKSFIITPPLFVSEPKSENTLRIIYTGPPLAADRESLFWMNVKTIPSVDKNALNGRNVLQLAILSRMKLFLRPIQLQELPAEAPDTLKFSRSGNYINVHNPSPFYVTLVNLQVGSQKLGNAMAAPRVNSQIPLPSGVQGKLKFQTVNDYGSVTPVREVNLN